MKKINEVTRTERGATLLPSLLDQRQEFDLGKELSAKGRQEQFLLNTCGLCLDYDILGRFKKYCHMFSSQLLLYKCFNTKIREKNEIG